MYLFNQSYTRLFSKVGRWVNHGNSECEVQTSFCVLWYCWKMAWCIMMICNVSRFYNWFKMVNDWWSGFLIHWLVWLHWLALLCRGGPYPEINLCKSINALLCDSAVIEHDWRSNMCTDQICSSSLSLIVLLTCSHFLEHFTSVFTSQVFRINFIMFKDIRLVGISVIMSLIGCLSVTCQLTGSLRCDTMSFPKSWSQTQQ